MSATESTVAARPVVREALAALGIDALLLGIHDPAFPGSAGADLGRGTPYSAAGRRFAEWVAGLGFTGLQLGPQGATPDDDASPYLGTLFARNPLSIDLAGLVAAELLPEAALERVTRTPGRRAQHRVAARAAKFVAEQVHRRFVERRPGEIASRLERFRATHGEWLDAGPLHQALADQHGQPHWRSWRQTDGHEHPDQRLWGPAADEHESAGRRLDELRQHHARALERDALVQMLLHEQHAGFHQHTRSLGLELYADLQVGVSELDAWRWRSLFLRGYVMGAPPSRTNPLGQPWHYPVLDPDQIHADAGDPGPALALFARRLAKIFAEYDGLRIDHPHGLVCPWVYDAAAPDRVAAVQAGARLHESPDLPDHPGLARYARIDADQLDRARPRHDDAWVRTLTEAQIDEYTVYLGAAMAAMREAGLSDRQLACELLSTCPRPLGAAMARYGMGRFRVTQKADTRRADDVYRGENAAPADWIMVGNHDTPTLWTVVRRWPDEERRAQAAYLSTRLVPDPIARESWAAQTAADPHALAAAKLADLFVGPARHVMVFFTDLFGHEQPYNVPGTVSDSNWSLRVPTDYAAAYRHALGRRAAFDLPAALASAIRARGGDFALAHQALAARLAATR